MRLFVIDPDCQILVDTQAGLVNFTMPHFPRLKVTALMRNKSGTSWWLINIHRLDNGNWLMITVFRPRMPMLTILGNELFIPLVVSCLIARMLSLIPAYWLALWIGTPLQKAVAAARQIPSAEARTMMPHGPRDVQALRRAFNPMNTRMQDSQKSQCNFVANVSYELKTPLTSIQGFAQAIHDGTAYNPKALQKAAQVIIDKSSRGFTAWCSTCSIWLAWMMVPSNCSTPPLAIPALFKSLAGKFTPQARTANVDTRVEAAILPPVTSDGDRLTQVSTNLVDNALKNTSTGDSITLQAKQMGSEIHKWT